MRRLWVSSELAGYSDWPHLAQVCRLERITHTKGGTRRETVYAVTSLPPEKADAARLLELWRGHWGIENRVHWVRDVTLDGGRSPDNGRAPQPDHKPAQIALGTQHSRRPPTLRNQTLPAVAPRRCVPTIIERPWHSQELALTTSDQREMTEPVQSLRNDEADLHEQHNEPEMVQFIRSSGTRSMEYQYV